jgi:hypothetical protein
VPIYRYALHKISSVDFLSRSGLIPAYYSTLNFLLYQYFQSSVHNWIWKPKELENPWRLKLICKLFWTLGIIKGTVSRDFLPLVFSSNCTPGSPNSWAKTVLHIDSNLRSNLILFDDENRLCTMRQSTASELGAMPHSADCESGLCYIAWSRNKILSAFTEVLKGQCHEIFDPRFFSSNNPP